MRPTLAQVCSLNSPFAEDIREYAAGQCHSVELWLTKLEQTLREKTVEQIRNLLSEQGVSAPVASFQGGLLDSQGEARHEAWELFRSRLAICQQLGVETIVVACDVAGPLDQTAVDRIQTSMIQIAQHAGASGLRAALEFHADAAFGNNLQTA